MENKQLINNSQFSMIEVKQSFILSNTKMNKFTRFTGCCWLELKSVKNKMKEDRFNTVGDNHSSIHLWTFQISLNQHATLNYLPITMNVNEWQTQETVNERAWNWSINQCYSSWYYKHRDSKRESMKLKY